MYNKKLIASPWQIKGRLAAANALNDLEKFGIWVLTPTEARKMIEWMDVFLYTAHIRYRLMVVYN